jgi:phage-related protein (TIGR01555 family)
MSKIFEKIKLIFGKPKDLRVPVEPRELAKDKHEKYSNGLVLLPTFAEMYEKAISSSLQRTAAMDTRHMDKDHNEITSGVAMDSNNLKMSTMDNSLNNMKTLASGAGYGVSPGVIGFFGSNGFIGHSLCAILNQHWLIEKACLMPAKDAVKSGYVTTVKDGTDVPPEVIDKMRELDEFYKINQNLVEFENKCRIFGIRIAIFKFSDATDEFYKNPFNWSFVKKGNYLGISQVDPYWCAPILDTQSASDPSAIDFYEPTYWIIGGKTYHKSHLVIIRNTDPPDILKPSYLYGGVPKTQQIYEKVYNAERAANEAPRLIMNKRCKVLKTDLKAAATHQAEFDRIQAIATQLESNFSLRVVDEDDEFSMIDTSLTDLDTTIMGCQQLVAAVAQVPAVKLFEVEPTGGFQSTGGFSIASYNTTLESIQTDHLNPLVERHHRIVILSDIVDEFNIEPFNVKNIWNPIEQLDAKAQSEVNKNNADTAAVLVTNAIIEPQEAREKFIADPKSGYSGIPDKSFSIKREEDEDDDDSDDSDETDSDNDEKPEVNKVESKNEDA